MAFQPRVARSAAVAFGVLLLTGALALGAPSHRHAAAVEASVPVVPQVSVVLLPQPEAAVAELLEARRPYIPRFPRIMFA
jgi:hypothetical protein